MRRTELLRKIRRAAQAANIDWSMVRQGANHEVWRCGGQQVSIPRHREINEVTARGIMKDLEGELGERWWR
jgi:mRNA interferase HicA